MVRKCENNNNIFEEVVYNTTDFFTGSGFYRANGWPMPMLDQRSSFDDVCKAIDKKDSVCFKITNPGYGIDNIDIENSYIKEAEIDGFYEICLNYLDKNNKQKVNQTLFMETTSKIDVKNATISAENGIFKVSVPKIKEEAKELKFKMRVIK